ncbi:DUF1674 domain-containing protein [Pseudoxanthobacter sp. M-2]|uniref:DUF1674 domain-containing protein n=1 Tax=Pseudoxanthobacter sp. M-2 TaxID=3078754 RepID=UPI0038FC0312
MSPVEPAASASPAAPETPTEAAPRPLSAAAERALAEAAERRRLAEEARPREIGGRGGLEPARYGDWEVKGLASDF